MGPTVYVENMISPIAYLAKQNHLWEVVGFSFLSLSLSESVPLSLSVCISVHLYRLLYSSSYSLHLDNI